MNFFFSFLGTKKNYAIIGLKAFLLMVVMSLGALAKTPVVLAQKAQMASAPVPPSNFLKLDTLAKQILLIDYTTGVILLEKNADELMAPSSMTKIMTAYILFENLKKGNIQMNTMFPVSERAWRMGGSKMFVPLNAMVSIEDLLKGIIS